LAGEFELLQAFHRRKGAPPCAVSGFSLGMRGEPGGDGFDDSRALVHGRKMIPSLPPLHNGGETSQIPEGMSKSWVRAPQALALK
jgi:hypothetical protein